MGGVERLTGLRGRAIVEEVTVAGGVLEAAWRTLRLKGEPPMTRFVAKEMATDHWFDITAARRDLAYHPLMTVAEGVKDLVAHYKAGTAF